MIADKWVPAKPDLLEQHLDTLNDYQVKINNHILSMSEVTNKIRTQRDQLISEDFDLKSQQMIVQRRENDLVEAQDKLADYYLRSPFSGVITRLDLEVGERVTSGVPIVTVQSVNSLEIKTNVPEVDIAKIKLSDRGEVTLDAYGAEATFDVVVSKIDPTEIVIEGVPTYLVTLNFLTADDERIRSGMTANIELITAEKGAVLVIPARAVITTNNNQFVRILMADKLVTRRVETGLRDASGNIEITRGLRAGDEVVVYVPNNSQ